MDETMKKAKYLVVSMVVIMAMMLPMAVSAASPVSGPVAVIGVPDGITVSYTGSVSDKEKADFTWAASKLGVPGSAVLYANITLNNPDGSVYHPGRGVLVRVDIAGVAPGDTVSVLHDNGTEIHLISATVYNGYVTFVTDQFSPFAFYLQKGAASASTTSTSPQTGVYA